MILVANALDDKTRVERGITTGAPSGLRKLFLASEAVRLAGVRPIILSFGRGREDGSGRYFRATVRRVRGVPVLYAPFVHRRIFSLPLSLFAPALLLWRINRLRGKKTAVFANRMPMYIPTLVVAALLRWRTVLALEDGEVGASRFSFGGAVSRLTCAIFEALCSGGAWLACSRLQEMTSLRPTMCYYGTVVSLSSSRDWATSPLSVVMCGSIWRSTGAVLLSDTIAKLRASKEPWTKELQFVVTGQGDCMDLFHQLAKADGDPKVVVRGRTSDSEYQAILGSAHVGLSLKPNVGVLADTTFPSKVLEFANCGLLVLSTDISDVRTVFGDSVHYLERDDVDLLIERLRWIVENRREAETKALASAKTVDEQFAPERAGRALAEFLFPD